MTIMKLSLAICLGLTLGNYAFAGDGDDDPPPAYDQQDDQQQLPPPQAYQQSAPPLPPPQAFDPGSNYVCNDPSCQPLPLPDGEPLMPVPPPPTYYYYNYAQPYVYGGGYYNGPGFPRRGYIRPGYGGNQVYPGRQIYGGIQGNAPRMGPRVGGNGVFIPGGRAPAPVGGGRPFGAAPRGHRVAFTGCEVKQLNNGEVVVLGLDDKVLFDRSTPKALEAADVVKKWYESNSSQCGFSNSSKTTTLDI